MLISAENSITLLRGRALASYVEFMERLYQQVVPPMPVITVRTYPDFETLSAERRYLSEQIRGLEKERNA